MMVLIIFKCHSKYAHNGCAYMKVIMSKGWVDGKGVVWKREWDRMGGCGRGGAEEG